jgi:uncharacterized protein (UPF0332 family)
LIPADHMQKASRALASARLLLADGDLEGACNRAYYAMFDAAHAALLASGAGNNPGETRTHRGLIAAFGKHLVQSGRMPAESGKSLNQVERIRLLADYTGEDIDREAAQWAVERAAEFIDAVQRQLLPSE